MVPRSSEYTVRGDGDPADPDDRDDCDDRDDRGIGGGMIGRVVRAALARSGLLRWSTFGMFTIHLCTSKRPDLLGPRTPFDAHQAVSVPDRIVDPVGQ